MIRSNEKKRLHALIRSVRLQKGGPDLSLLSSEQLAAFHRWQGEQAGLEFETTLLHNVSHKTILRRDIEIVLWNEPTEIFETDTPATAAEKYRLLLENKGMI